MLFFACTIACIMGDDDLLAAAITEQEGVVDDSKSLLGVVEEIEGSPDPIAPMDVRPNAFDSIADALVAYKEGALFEAGKGKNRGYALTVGFGVAGILSLVTGGLLMANNRPVLGSIGIGASAGCGVGSFVTYPKTVPFVGYHLRVEEDRYVSIRLPKGLSDESFVTLSAEQETCKVEMDDYSVPTVHILEQIEARRDHADEVASALPMGTDTDTSSSSSSSSSSNSDPTPPPPTPATPATPAPAAQPDPLAQKEKEEAAAPVKGRDATPSVVESRSKKEQKADKKGSGVVQV